LEILYSNREVRKTISAENQKTEGTASSSSSDSVETGQQESFVSSQVQALLLEKTNQMGNETNQLISKLNDVTDSLQKL
jgi:mRNA deadenylase 3'-5' endonuclease subunit Ccr4